MMATNTTGVVVRLKSGAEYGVKDAATAQRIYPNGTIVRNQDGSPYEAPSDADTTPNLAEMTRGELNAYAERLGIEDADDLPNKDAVVKAVEDAQA